MMKSLRLISILMLTLVSVLPLMADRTLRGKLRTAATKTSPVNRTPPTLVFDTLRTPDAEKVRLSGYDKPLNSRIESLFVSNNTGSEICGIEITLVYSDLQGRTLHQAKRLIRADIPSGTTRRIQFSSWDTQNSFYYRHSRRPRTANVTPYDVTCTVNSCILSPSDGSSAEQNIP
ncbi:MAG: hypothetical protein K2F88_00410 [Duncaniella sp.]|uniref:hypothetical protein n=1 Tax=Duncaniella sp. TaxID=2518496 RepID=UPI0023D34D65|nr:hypothetical protein [Duncaniella sp.]MDE5989432.1 hypothetical protein [Duncaniella sp.]MDE6174012.1 hypothetical protein [Duncaniella sp.]